MITKKVERLVSKQLYVCVFDEEEENILVEKVQELTDPIKVRNFFSKYKYKISSYLQKEYGISAEKSKRWAQEAVRQAKSFFRRLAKLIDDASHGIPVDFSKEFELYKQFSGYPGLKIYGPRIVAGQMIPHNRRSLIRLWALEVGKAYLIVFAGIKLDYKIEDCAGLKDELIPRLKAAALYLQSRQVGDENDLERLIEMLE